MFKEIKFIDITNSSQRQIYPISWGFINHDHHEDLNNHLFIDSEFECLISIKTKSALKCIDLFHRYTPDFKEVSSVFFRVCCIPEVARQYKLKNMSVEDNVTKILLSLKDMITQVNIDDVLKIIDQYSKSLYHKNYAEIGHLDLKPYHSKIKRKYEKLKLLM